MNMAFFKGTPTAPDNCVMVLEAKGLGDPLDARVSQPQRYVDDAALGSVRYVLTTDGPTLFLYERTAEGWTPDPVGHLDVASIQRSYLLPERTSPVETLVRL
jgi:hypothetical protein